MLKAIIGRKCRIKGITGIESSGVAGLKQSCTPNGKSTKTIKGKRGQVEIDVPRDRDSSFEPQFVKKGQTRFDGLDDKIIGAGDK